MRASIRQRVVERANGCCEYCRMPQTLDVLPFQIDHVRPQKHSGSSSLHNLALACFYCNSYKGSNAAGYDPATDALTRLFNPRNDLWGDHFECRGALVEGKTDVGRATVEVLRFNESSRVEHRRLLIELGEISVVD